SDQVVPVALVVGEDVEVVEAVDEVVAKGVVLGRVLHAVEEAQRRPGVEPGAERREHEADLALPGVAVLAVAVLEAAGIGDAAGALEDRVDVVAVGVAVGGGLARDAGL